MHLEGLIADLLAGQQLAHHVRIAGRGDQRREPVEPGDNAVLDLARRHLPGPAHDRRHAEAAFETGALAAGKRCLSAVRPGEILGAVVGGEHDDGVVVEPVALQVGHHRADDIVELRHAGFLDAPAVLGVAQRFILLGQMRHDVHARRVEPHEERLLVGARLVDELQRVVEDFVVDRLHPLGIERSGILDPLLADLAPARLLGRIVAVRRPGVDHVARTDHVLQCLWIVAMRRVLHRVQMVEVAEELVEPVHGRQELVEIAEVVLAELAGGVSRWP